MSKPDLSWYAGASGISLGRSPGSSLSTLAHDQQSRKSAPLFYDSRLSVKLSHGVSGAVTRPILDGPYLRHSLTTARDSLFVSHALRRLDRHLLDLANRHYLSNNRRSRRSVGRTRRCRRRRPPSAPSGGRRSVRRSAGASGAGTAGSPAGRTGRRS